MEQLLLPRCRRRPRLRRWVLDHAAERRATLFTAHYARSSAGLSPGTETVAENFRIPSDTPGVELIVRSKRRADPGATRAERTALFVHGSSYPAPTVFDFPLNGVSWMNWIAARRRRLPFKSDQPPQTLAVAAIEPVADRGNHESTSSNAFRARLLSSEPATTPTHRPALSQ